MKKFVFLTLLLALTMHSVCLSQSQNSGIPEKIKEQSLSYKTDKETLDPIVFEAGKAKLKLKIYNFELLKDSKVQALISLTSPLKDIEQYIIDIDETGTMEQELETHANNTNASIWIKPFQSQYFVLSANSTQELHVDALELMTSSNLLKGYWIGPNADINNYPATLGENIFYTDINEAFQMQDANQKKNFLDINKDSMLEKAEKSSATPRAKDFMRCMINNTYLYNMNILIPRDLQGSEMFSFVKGDDFLSDRAYYHFGLGQDALRTINIMIDSHFKWPEIITKAFDILFDRGILTPNDKENVENCIAKMTEENNPNSRTAPTICFNQFNMLCDSLLDAKRQEIFEKICPGKAEFYNTQKTLQKIKQFYIGSWETIPDNEFEKLKQLGNPHICEVFKKESDKIAEERQKSYYNGHQEGFDKMDDLWTELLKDYKGKVIMVLKWGQGCGPCHMAINDIKPEIQNMKAKGVEFVFIADTQEDFSGCNNIIFTPSQEKTFTEKYGTPVPAIFIINKRGQIANKTRGYFPNGYKIIYENKLNELVAEE